MGCTPETSSMLKYVNNNPMYTYDLVYPTLDRDIVPLGRLMENFLIAYCCGDSCCFTGCHTVIGQHVTRVRQDSAAQQITYISGAGD